MKSKYWLLLISGLFAVSLVVAGLYLRRISVRPTRILPRLGAFPDFALPDASGRIWRKADLRGSIWVAGSFPPSCRDCATLALKLTDLQTSLEKARSVVLVSFVSDAALKSASRLAELAREFGARPGRWVFLSGEAGGMDPARVCLVDAGGEIRGEYDFRAPDFSSEALDAVGDLLRERKPGL